jgi:PAS domain S-box-containing protein
LHELDDDTVGFVPHQSTTPPTDAAGRFRSRDDDSVNERALSAVADVLATTPGVMFCVKGLDGTYLAANQAFAERAGLAGPGEVIGRRARDLFPIGLAERYEAQDDAVLSTGRPLTNELELITRPDRSYGWFLTSKSRWTDGDGEPVGMVSVSVDLRTPADAAARHEQLARAVEYARRNHASAITVTELADVARMSVTQLERAARSILGLSPKQLIIRFRIEAALALLETTDASIADIATRCGYYDQSAFSRHFRRTVGTSPAAHRRRIHPEV